MGMSNLTNMIEQQELVEKLKSSGYGKLVEALLANDQECYTKKGRLNKSGTCRVLGCKPKELDDAIEECKRLCPEWSLEED